MSSKTFFELPTYEQDRLLNPSEPALPSTLPSDSATPNDVQTYITHFLINTNTLDGPSARAIASKWQMGTGRELRKYPAQMYREIFGSEAGWAIFKDVKTKAREEEEEKIAPKRRGWVIGLASGMVLLFTCVMIVVFGTSIEDQLKALVGVFGFFTMILFGCGLFIAKMNVKPRDAAEMELLAAFNQAPPLGPMP